MTKIDIVSGFLGAGKTTLIKKLLKECFQNEKVVLVENEFGEIGVDGAFLKEVGIQVNEINSGCICCSLKGDFSKALGQVMETYHPDRILIEPSGVGKLSDVIDAAKAGVGEEGVLNSFTTVADVTKAKMYAKNFGEFYRDQITAAHTVILSRTGKAPQAKTEQALALIREMNPTATVITTPWEELAGEALLAAMESHPDMMSALMEEVREARRHAHEHGHHHHDHDHECDDPSCSCHDHHHHHADEVFTSWGVQTPRAFARTQLEEILDELDLGTYGMVLRAKGVLPSEGCWLHFDMTPGEHEIREGGADYTGRICVIGSGIKEHALAHLFGLED